MVVLSSSKGDNVWQCCDGPHGASTGGQLESRNPAICRGTQPQFPQLSATRGSAEHALCGWTVGRQEWERAAWPKSTRHAGETWCALSSSGGSTGNTAPKAPHTSPQTLMSRCHILENLTVKERKSPVLKKTFMPLSLSGHHLLV